jgi:hypothetical protein
MNSSNTTKKGMAFPGVWRWQQMVSTISSFLTGGASDLTPEQKARVAEMEKDYVDWTRKKHEAAGGDCVLDVTLSNPSKVVALMTRIQLRKQSANDRVLPVYYDDNCVSLLPGESKTIKVEAALKNLGGAKPLVAVDGWNPAVKSRTFGGGAGNAPSAPALVIGAPAPKL